VYPEGHEVAPVHIVAITELSAGPDAAWAALASELATTAYELRLAVAGGLPAVVLATVDPVAAQSALAAIERHGHLGAVCDRARITPSDRMTTLVDFALGPAGLTATARGADDLPYRDLQALVRATRCSASTSTHQVSERTLRPGMAIVTGGLVMSKKTKREVVSRTETREQVLYLFRKSGAPPWILRERSARYAGLGADLRPTSLENFATTIAQLRARAPHAAYDDRLVAVRAVRGVADGSDATDLLAQLIATHLAFPR